jgi:dephospho-CoA kinase
VRIGLTGPIGCGKTTVAHWLGEEPGVVVIDADEEARAVLAPGTPELAAVYARFGGSLRGANGALDRAALGRVVFADPVALRDLEAIVHPAVRPRILSAIRRADEAGATAVTIEAIKLVEGGLAEVCDEVWLVTCDADSQAARLVNAVSSRATRRRASVRRATSWDAFDPGPRAHWTRVAHATPRMPWRSRTCRRLERPPPEWRPGIRTPRGCPVTARR